MAAVAATVHSERMLPHDAPILAQIARWALKRPPHAAEEDPVATPRRASTP